MVSPRIFPMVPCGSPIVLCCFPMVLCHGAAIRHSPAQLCGLPDGAPFAAASSQRHQPIVASAALPLPCRSPSAAAVTSVPRSPVLQKSLRRSGKFFRAAQSGSTICHPAAAPRPGGSCELANPAQMRQIASQTGDLLRQMMLVAGRRRHRENLLTRAP